MQSALAAALANGELFTVYQPQMSADGARVLAAEALLRWRQPGGGSLTPDDFLSVAEGGPLIGRLGAHVLEAACRTAAAWRDVVLSVNVSPTQFADPGLADFILRVTREAGLPTKRLEIEITEHAPFADIEAAARVLARLRAEGLTVALDDLGSGYSTPEAMDRLPLDRVKLGKPMIEKCATAQGAREVCALVSRALDRGLEVTAEGVETQGQLAQLRRWGCDRIQGFFFARPMTGAELGAFARHLQK